jgi:hypothetical protein
MKKYILVSILMLATMTGKSQDSYVEYYKLVNKANRNRYEKNYTKSLKLFQEGFEKVAYVHSMNYAKAARCVVNLKDYELTKDYLLEAMKRGYPLDLVENQDFKKFRKTNFYKELEVQMHEIGRQKGIDSSYKQKVDSLYYIDQKILRGNKNIQARQYEETLKYSDALNFKCLLKLIEENGFPSEQTIGYEGYKKSWVIIHHNARLPENKAYHEVLLQYLQKVEYLPENYCWVID